MTPAEQRRVDTIFALSSILTPFALGTAIGAIASERVRVGNPGGSVVSSWLHPTSIAIGVLAVASSAYTAAVFLSGDAERHGERHLTEQFRRRALAAGVVAGAVAVAGLVVLRFDAERVYHRLTHGAGLPALVVSVLAGVATLFLVWRRRYEPARYTAALAVAATIAGWALAQNPVFVRGLTVREAAAGHDTLIALVVAVIAGGVILFPSLALLFRLTLGGRLGHAGPAAGEQFVRGEGALRRSVHGGRIAAASLVAGIGFLTLADAAWAHAVGIAFLFTFIVAGYRAVLGDDIL
jgi:cytochrome d ubiquinol oxidase subunit II